MTKLLKQAGICVIIVLTVLLAKSIDREPINKGTQVLAAQLSKNYSVEEVMTFARDSVKTITKAPVTITNAVLSAEENGKYGQPMDESKKGETVSVYAVGAGTVAAVGENEKIGKFIKIVHGEEAQTIYGNCGVIYAKELDRVKKGQIIATYKNDGERDFYYSFQKLK